MSETKAVYLTGCEPRITAKCKERKTIHWDELKAWERLKGLSPEERLYRAIVLQLLLDLGSKSKNPENIHAKFQARHLLIENKHRLRDLCDLARLDMEHVRKTANRIDEQGLSWRAAAGMGKRYLERRAYRARSKKV